MGKARPVRVSCFANVSVLNEKGLPFKLRKGVKPGPTCTVCAYTNRMPRRAARPRTGQGRQERSGLRRGRDGDVRRGGGRARTAITVDLCIYLSDKDTHDQGIATVEYDNGATASHAEYFPTPLSNRHYMIEGKLAHGEADVAGEHGSR